MPTRLLTLLAFSGLLILAACNGEDMPADDPEMDTEADQIEQQQQEAVADLSPTEGSDVTGRVTFQQENGGVRVVANVQGLSAGQPHGFHVHEFGDCSAPDASSAGDHFAPMDSPHGGPEDPAEERHVGDLGNLDADEEGNAEYNRVDDVITLEGANSIIDKAVLVHADEDDLESQPSGDAGDRLACGVIEWSDGGGTDMNGDTDIN